MHNVSVQSAINLNFLDSYSSVASLHPGTYGVVADGPREVTDQEALIITHISMNL